MTVQTFKLPTYCVACQAPLTVVSTGETVEHDCGDCGVVRLGLAFEGPCPRCGQTTCVSLVLEGPDVDDY